MWGYLEYRGDAQYCGGYLEYRGGVQYCGDIKSIVGVILSTVEDTQYHGGYSVPRGYHDAHGDIMSTVGCSVPWGEGIFCYLSTLMVPMISLHMYHDIPKVLKLQRMVSLMVLNTPTVLMISPTCIMISPMVLKIVPTVLMISPTILNIPQYSRNPQHLS